MADEFRHDDMTANDVQAAVKRIVRELRFLLDHEDSLPVCIALSVALIQVSEDNDCEASDVLEQVQDNYNRDEIELPDDNEQIQSWGIH